MSCVYTSGQTWCLQPKRHDISISKQTSSGLPACSPGFKDVLIKLFDSQDSKTVQRIQHESCVWISVGELVLPQRDSVHAHKYFVANIMENPALRVDLPVKSMALLVDSCVSGDRHGNKRPLQLHLCAAFCTATAWCKRPSLPSQHLFHSHCFPFVFPTCFDHCFSFRFPTSVGQSVVLFFEIIMFATFFLNLNVSLQ